MIYLDNNATTRVSQQVITEMAPYFQICYGNPSSLHAFGQIASQKTQEVRSSLAHKLSCDAHELIFTSSGTEANNLCLKGFAYANRYQGKHIITTEIEHPSILETCAYLAQNGFDISYLKVDSEGFVSPNSLRETIRKDTILISIGHVNNEIGTIQPLEELLSVSKNIPFHSDVVQSFLKTDFNIKKYPVAMASFSGHKIHAPKGIAFVYKKKEIQLQPHTHGGSQEMNLRSGTENLPYIVALGKAVEIYQADYNFQMKELQSYLISELINKFDVKVNGPSSLESRVCSNINVSFPFIEGETLLRLLSNEQVYVSTGSACSSKNSRTSHVLRAIQCPTSFIHGNIRIGLSTNTTLEEVNKFLTILTEVTAEQQLFSLSPQ